MWVLQQVIQFATERYQQAEIQLEKKAAQLAGSASCTMPLRAAFFGLYGQQRWGKLHELFERFTDWLEQADIPGKLKQYEQEQMAELQRQKYEIPGIDYNLMDEHTKARVREALDREWERKQAAEAFAREAEAMYQAGMERRQSIMDNPKHFPAFKEHYEQEAQHYISLIENLLPKDSDAYKWYYGYAYLIANSQDELSGMYNERRVNELLAMVEGKAAMALGSMIPSRPSTPIPEPKLPNFNFKGTGNGIRRDTIINSATQPKKGGETVVGHALQKHAGRNPDIWGKVKGGPDQINKTAQKHLEEIIDAPGDFVMVTNDRGITFLEKKLPDGRGVRLNLDGTFKGFIDQ